MAGIIGIYGLVVSVLISDGLKQEMPLYTGFIQLGAGLSVGLAGLAAGYAKLSPLAPSTIPFSDQCNQTCLRQCLASLLASSVTLVYVAPPSNPDSSSA